MEKQTYTPHWGRRTYTKEEFIDAWESSRSFSQCAKKLGLVIYGSTPKTLKSTANYLGLSDSHMTGQGWNSGSNFRSPNPSKPIEYYLVKGSQISSSKLKKKILQEGLLIDRCSAPFCPNPDTTIDGLTGESIKTPTNLDHINGINNDNRLENLRLLCPNCDRGNPTYCRGSGNRKKSNLSNSKKDTNLICPKCGGKKSNSSKRCKSCYLNHLSNNKDKVFKPVRKPIVARSTKIDWPSDDELISLVSESSFLAVSRNLGVSDNAIRKRLKTRGRLSDIKT